MLSSLIRQKQDVSRAFRPTSEQVSAIHSQVDHFPFYEFFRGQISEEPHVFAREAGWRPQVEYLYREEKSDIPDCCSGHKFEAPCNTVYTGDKCSICACVNTYR